MINLHMSVLVYSPVAQVFDFVSTPENDFQWQYGTLASTTLSQGGGHSGTFFRSIRHLVGRRVEGTFEVTLYEPNRKYGFKSLSGPLNSQTSYTFEMVDGSTRISLSTQARVVNSLRVDDAILEKGMKKQLKEDLAMLKALLETKRMPPGNHVPGEI
jgi:hypothetical protein